MSLGKLLGVMGVVLGLLGLFGSVFLLLREATLISLTRDLIGSTASLSSVDRDFLLNWLNVLASSWSFSIICFMAFSLILTAFSASLLIASIKRRV